MVGIQPIFERTPRSLGQLPQRKEMAIVIEESVVGMQSLRLDTRRQPHRHLLTLDVLAIGTDPNGVVFTQPSILADLCAIHRHIAENYRQFFARAADIVAIGGKIFYQRIDFP